MNSSDAAIVSWTRRSRGDAGNRIAVRPAAGGHFAAPEAISPCAPGVSAGGSGRDNLGTAPHSALDAAGRTIAIFANGCGGGVGAARRPAGGLWQPAFGVTPPPTTVPSGSSPPASATPAKLSRLGRRRRGP
jgi:hypothetical protein